MGILTKEVNTVVREVPRSDGQIEVEKITTVFEDGVEIARGRFCHVVTPLDDVSNEDPKVIAVAGVIHTPEVIEAFRLKREERQEEQDRR